MTTKENQLQHIRLWCECELGGKWEVRPTTYNPEMWQVSVEEQFIFAGTLSECEACVIGAVVARKEKV
jgi:hypothetical protein